MLIAILSDTHDRTEPLVRALHLLRGRGPHFYIHCGDVGGQRVLDQLAGLPCTFIWGNNDFDVASLQDYATRLGLTCAGRRAELTLDGKTFFVTHGDDTRAKLAAIAGQQFDYVLQGHTHVFSDETIGRTRVINPGALHRANPKTAALLDTESGRLEKLIIV
jgi:putative phosphoesterase